MTSMESPWKITSLHSSTHWLMECNAVDVGWLHGQCAIFDSILASFLHPVFDSILASFLHAVLLLSSADSGLLLLAQNRPAEAKSLTCHNKNARHKVIPCQSPTPHRWQNLKLRLWCHLLLKYKLHRHNWVKGSPHQAPSTFSSLLVRKVCCSYAWHASIHVFVHMARCVYKGHSSCPCLAGSTRTGAAIEDPSYKSFISFTLAVTTQ